MGNWIEQMEEDVGKHGGYIYDEFEWIVRHCLSEVPPAERRRTNLSFSMDRLCDSIIEHAQELREVRECKDPIIEDGFGGAWSKVCPMCEKPTMTVVRPGKVQCDNPECDN